MAHAKDKHYWSQLRAALTAGQWSSAFPAKTPNGSPLSWSELFRKFNKHCGGYSDVVEVASQTHALALLLGVSSSDEDQALNEQSSYKLLVLGDECMLLEERLDEASQGYNVLKKIPATNFDSLHLALAYYAYALGRPSECLAHLAEVPDLCNIRSPGPTSLFDTTRSNGSTLQVPSGGADASSSISSGSFMTSDTSASVADVNDGRAWATIETIRSICLQGMCHEKMSPGDLDKPLKIYCTAIPYLTSIESEIPSAMPKNSSHPSGYGANKLDFSSFTRYRELWRWVERVLWRAIILAARTCTLKENDDEGILTEHRSTIGVIYLRVLILRARLPASSSQASSLRSLDSVKSPPWLITARSVIQEYRAILNVSTRFPKAGERNVKVEEFIDLCVAVWETSGAIGDHAGWVIDTLWWATRLTFNSYRIFRHMTRLFYVSGDVGLAKRTLRLYVQVVGKAYEAGGAGVGVDADSDRNWVETLVQGARMLCRIALAGVGLVGVDDGREAGTLITKARTRLSNDHADLVASVDLAEGVWNLVMAHKEQDPRSRPDRLSRALSLLNRSVSTFPTPSAYYHLALALNRPGPSQDLDEAINNAGSAVEGAPSEIRFWHLLGLLLMAAERWQSAREVLERGMEIGEAVGEDTAVADGVETIQARNSASSEISDENEDMRNGVSGHNGTQSPTDLQYFLDKNAVEVPLAETLLLPTLDHPPPSRLDLFEQALQLQMTQVTLTEYVDGPERAGDRWVEVFLWIGENKGTVSEQMKADASRPSMDTRSPSPADRKPYAATISQNHTTDSHLSDNSPPESIPVTVTPATPAAVDRGQFSTNTVGGGNGNVPAAEPRSGKHDTRYRRSSSMERDTSKGKKVQQMLKNRVNKGQARITTISRKIGHGVTRNGVAQLRRINSAPDFQLELQQSHYQASSIHSRRRLASIIRQRDVPPIESPPPPPPPALPPIEQTSKWSKRTAKENRLLSDLWLMSAATFRRVGKIEQAKGAIQEAEVKDENNPAVWVQLGLYHIAHGRDQHAIEAFHKALFIDPDDVSATIHLSRLHVAASSFPPSRSRGIDSDYVDLAAGMLYKLTDGPGWDVPEAWYFLGKAYGQQGRKEREKECLAHALELAQRRGIRDIGYAVGWCL